MPYYHRKHVKATINHQLLPGRNIFWTPRAERTTAGLMPPGAFLVFFFLSSWSLAPDLRSVKTILAGNLGSFSVISPEFS